MGVPEDLVPPVLVQGCIPEHSIIRVGFTRTQKNYRFCPGIVPILPHPSLCRALKLRYLTDVAGIVLDGRITSEFGTGRSVCE